MKYFSKNIYFVALLLVFINSSCKKFVTIPPPKNEIVTSAVFSDSADANAAVLGIYINMMQSISLAFMNGGNTIYPAMSADEIYPSDVNSEDQEFYNNSILTNNSINSVLWRTAYLFIYDANACIEGLSSSKSLSAGVKDQLIGEVKFIRAFLYFNLVNLYGKVPLVLTTNYHENEILPRSSIEQIYSQVSSDLNDAKNLLQNSFSTDKLRPDRFAVIALLAKVYLYQKKWKDAEEASGEIIDSGIFNLESDLNNVFHAGSKETIWSISPVFPGVETWEGYYFVPATNSATPRYIISNYLLNAFEAGDQRKVNWIDSNIVTNQTYYYPHKYKLGYDGQSIPLENYVVFRLAEQYLIRAEARAEQNNLSASISDLNIIRARSALSPVTVSDQTFLVSQIQHERQVELFCEWGNRWLDLKRTDSADLILGLEKGPNWQETDALYPIPQTELINNPSLSQNLGY